jgi:bis(5'-nucleosyl)-tetraphosphatase (symmetrical)
LAVYAVGDVQGCYDDLLRLLEKIHFDPARDRLWFAGDLVNRGPRSLEVLRFVKGLGDAAVTVLGNHDLHLLAMAHGNERFRGRDHSLDAVLQAADREELIHWLRHRPLLHHSAERNFSLLHAGLPPQWDIATAELRAREVETVLQGDGLIEFCQQMYGDEPRVWGDELHGMERLRFIVNCFTRLRFCNRRGALMLKEKGAPGAQRGALYPWFQAPNRKSHGERIIFGHWSTLGYRHTDNVWAIDTGCVWGKELTAIRIRRKKPPKPVQVRCPAPSLRQRAA